MFACSRCGRAIKTLNEMIRDVGRGKAVREEDVPPMVSVKASAAASVPRAARPAPAVPNAQSDEGVTSPPVPPRPSPRAPLRGNYRAVGPVVSAPDDVGTS